jgi:glycosyltransferase involved in cell wall biosynthesis
MTATAGEAAASSWPAVSVVVPTRDRPELLRVALASIMGQDYPGDVEALVVFDQSEPDQQLAEQRAGRRVTVMTNTRSPGLAGGRNTGVLASRRELVAFCDDDDSWSATKLRVQVKALRAEPDAVMVTCGLRVHYGDEVVERTLDLARVGLQDLLRSRLTELHPSTFVLDRAAVLDRVGLVDEDIPGSYAEDYELLLRAARVHPIVHVHDTLVDVVWHPKSFFSGRWPMIAEALTWLLDRYPEFAEQPKGLARITGQIAFAYAASGRRREGWKWALRTVRHNPREARAYLAMAVATRVVSADRIVTALNRRGRGI